jgi:hypothetical protein
LQHRAHLDAVDVALDGAGVVGQGEAVADGVVVALQAGGEGLQVGLVVVAFGTTAAEEQQGESLDQRLCREEPDVTADPDLDEPRSRSDYDDDEASDESDEFFDEDEVGDSRSGRLLAEDEGYGPDLEKDEVAGDVASTAERRRPKRPRCTLSSPDVLSRARRPGSCEPGRLAGNELAMRNSARRRC